MFMTSEVRSAIENFVPQDKLSSLTAYGFQTGIIITADKNEDATDLSVKIRGESKYRSCFVAT